MNTLQISLSWLDWLVLIKNFLLFSLMAVGGPLVLLPEMKRLLVDQHAWLTDEQLSASVVIAQAAPGPNFLFVAILGWNVGLNAGDWRTAALGAAATTFAILLPSSMLILAASHWIHRNRDKAIVRAFKQGMAPLVISLLFCSAWALASANMGLALDWRQLVAIVCVVGLVLWGKVHMLWLLGFGAVLGAFGVFPSG